MNRICREKPSNDAVPVGHRILRRPTIGIQRQGNFARQRDCECSYRERIGKKRRARNHLGLCGYRALRPMVWSDKSLAAPRLMLGPSSFSLVLAIGSVEDSGKLGKPVGATVGKQQPGLPVEAEINGLHPGKAFLHHLYQFISCFCLWLDFIVSVQIPEGEVNTGGVFEV